jgi:hypothetical protein
VYYKDKSIVILKDIKKNINKFSVKIRKHHSHHIVHDI